MINNELFNSIDDHQQIKVIESLKEVNLKKGEFIFWQSDPAKYVYYVKSGNIKVFKTSANGNETIFDIYDPNSFVALGVLFNDPQVYPASGCAVNDATIYVIPVPVIEEAIVANPISARKWISYMNKRLTLVQRKLSEQIFSDSMERFRNLVRYFMSKYPSRQNNKYIKIDVPITKQEMAEILNIRRETFSRMLSTLKDEDKCISNYKELIVNKSWLMEE